MLIWSNFVSFLDRFYFVLHTIGWNGGKAGRILLGRFRLITFLDSFGFEVYVLTLKEFNCRLFYLSDCSWFWLQMVLVNFFHKILIKITIYVKKKSQKHFAKLNVLMYNNEIVILNSLNVKSKTQINKLYFQCDLFCFFRYKWISFISISHQYKNTFVRFEKHISCLFLI